MYNLVSKMLKNRESAQNAELASKCNAIKWQGLRKVADNF